MKCAARGALHRHQEGVIDIAAAIFPQVQDPAPGGKLLGHGEKVHVLSPGREIIGSVRLV